MNTIEPAYGTVTLLLIAVAAVLILLVLILRFRLHAFVALVLVSLDHRARHPDSLRRRGADAPRGLRQHARHGGAPRRVRRDDRPAARGDRRGRGAGRPADRPLRRGPRALRARRSLAPLRLPDLLRRRPRRHAADHLLRRLAARRLGPDLRAAGGGRLRGDARLRAAAPGAGRRRRPPRGRHRPSRLRGARDRAADLVSRRLPLRPLGRPALRAAGAEPAPRRARPGERAAAGASAP